MKETNQSNIGWVINNGSGWNNHTTAKVLEQMTAELPTVPLGYGVLVAPISDKPFGLRCALVKVLPRKIVPMISIHTAGGNYVQHPDSVKYDHIRLADIENLEAATALLAANNYQPTTDRPPMWPTGLTWFRHADGTWASIEMLDDGCDGDADGWASVWGGFDAERIYSVKCEQQSDDDSQFFIREMTEQISKL